MKLILIITVVMISGTTQFAIRDQDAEEKKADVGDISVKLTREVNSKASEDAREAMEEIGVTIDQRVPSAEEAVESLKNAEAHDSVVRAPEKKSDLGLKEAKPADVNVKSSKNVSKRRARNVEIHNVNVQSREKQADVGLEDSQADDTAVRAPEKEADMELKEAKQDDTVVRAPEEESDNLSKNAKPDDIDVKSPDLLSQREARNTGISLNVDSLEKKSDAELKTGRRNYLAVNAPKRESEVLFMSAKPDELDVKLTVNVLKRRVRHVENVDANVQSPPDGVNEKSSENESKHLRFRRYCERQKSYLRLLKKIAESRLRTAENGESDSLHWRNEKPYIIYVNEKEPLIYRRLLRYGRDVEIHNVNVQSRENESEIGLENAQGDSSLVRALEEESNNGLKNAKPDDVDVKSSDLLSQSEANNAKVDQINVRLPEPESVAELKIHDETDLVERAPEKESDVGLKNAKITSDNMSKRRARNVQIHNVNVGSLEKDADAELKHAEVDDLVERANEQVSDMVSKNAKPNDANVESSDSGAQRQASHVEIHNINVGSLEKESDDGLKNAEQVDPDVRTPEKESDVELKIGEPVNMKSSKNLSKRRARNIEINNTNVRSLENEAENAGGGDLDARTPEKESDVALKDANLGDVSMKSSDNVSQLDSKNAEVDNVNVESLVKNVEGVDSDVRAPETTSDVGLKNAETDDFNKRTPENVSERETRNVEVEVDIGLKKAENHENVLRAPEKESDVGLKSAGTEVENARSSENVSEREPRNAEVEIDVGQKKAEGDESVVRAPEKESDLGLKKAETEDVMDEDIEKDAAEEIKSAEEATADEVEAERGGNSETRTVEETERESEETDVKTATERSDETAEKDSAEWDGDMTHHKVIDTKARSGFEAETDEEGNVRITEDDASTEVRFVDPGLDRQSGTGVRPIYTQIPTINPKLLFKPIFPSFSNLNPFKSSREHSYPYQPNALTQIPYPDPTYQIPTNYPGQPYQNSFPFTVFGSTTPRPSPPPFPQWNFSNIFSKLSQATRGAAKVVGDQFPGYQPYYYNTPNFRSKS